MKPARFEYYDPTTLDEAVGLLSRLGPEAKVLAGGQSLIPAMNLRLARPKYLVDLRRIPDLAYIRRDNGEIRIGAMTTHEALERSPLLAEFCPIMPAAARLIGHMQIRARGTIGGSVAHADPAAEWPMVLTALDARIVVRGSGGERELAAGEFFLSYLTTALAPDEIVVEIRVPVPPTGHGWSVLEVTRRHGDFALVATAALVTLAGGRVNFIRLAVGGVGGTPVAPPEVQALVGTNPAGADLRALAQQVAAGLDPDADLHASVEYRRELAEVLTCRALGEALARAAGG